MCAFDLFNNILLKPAKNDLQVGYAEYVWEVVSTHLWKQKYSNNCSLVKLWTCHFAVGNWWLMWNDYFICVYVD